MADDKNKNLRLLEALLFASGEPMSTHALHERMPEGADVGGLLMRLQDEYKDRGINLMDVQGQWAFRTALDLAGELNIEKQVSKKLSRAAMETLSIIAYHQPVTRAEIENIRGVGTHKGTLDMLMEMGWIKPGRRRESIGRPLTWVSTSAFLDHFSLEAITDLPGMDEMKASGLLDRRPAIETIHQDDLFAGKASDENAMPTDIESVTGQEPEESVEEDEFEYMEDTIEDTAQDELEEEFEGSGRH